MSSSELGLQALEQVGMDAGIDFLAEDLLGTLDGQRGDLLAQGFAGAHGLLLGLVAGSRDDLAGLFVRTALGFFDDLLGAALGVGKTAGGLGARRRQFLFDALVGGLQFGLGLVGGRQARGDLLCPVIQSLRDRRPHESHREQHEQQEDDGLNEQGRVDTHGNTFLEWR
ncbi:unnamed protein product [Brugia timori]|uniref:NAD-specific glutamate dehydrogenase n=1 Tax=Brugia timori TaxID=42155 RepID=A0A0R3RCR8_9BILA|nr:unnamed protein product [Brugia timori]